MAKWVHRDVFDNGLKEIVNNANQMHLITSYAPDDSYSVVIGRSVANVAVAAADLTLTNFGTNERKIDVAAKSGTATGTSPTTPDLHIALVDSTGSRVLAVANETSDQPIVAGNVVNWVAWEVRGRQPS